VRDTLVECWTQMVHSIGGGFANCFGANQAVSALLRALLDDAQANVSEHARAWPERGQDLDKGGPDITVISPSGETSTSLVGATALTTRKHWNGHRANPEVLMALVPQA